MEGHGESGNRPAALSLTAVSGATATVPGGDIDHLSRLPGDLLICILLKLTTKDAVRTSVLSKQWSLVWTLMPVLDFDGVGSSVPLRALAAYQAHGEVDIDCLTVSPNKNQVNTEDIESWMSIAAPILSGGLCLDNSLSVTPDAVEDFLSNAEAAVVTTGVIVLPCFNKATEIWLDLGFHGLALPPAGIFHALRVLWLANFWCGGQLNLNDNMLPSLEDLTIRRCRGLVGLTLECRSVIYTHLSALGELQQLSIVAPRLVSLEVKRCFYLPQSSANIAAERIEILRWEVDCVLEIGEMPDLCLIRAPPITTFGSEYACAEFLSHFGTVNHLELEMSLGMMMDGYPLLMENIKIPHVNVLSLHLDTNDHVFEGRVLQLLIKSSMIKELNLLFQSREKVKGYCDEHCICHTEPLVWGDKPIQAMFLKRVTILNFNGAPREVNLVDAVVQRAPNLEALTVYSNVEDPCLDGIEEIAPAEFKIYVQWNASATGS